jgi:uncharacterized protein YehS (DUF1456 family)
MLDNNDVLRRLRYALNLSDKQLSGVFALAGDHVPAERARALVGREDEEDAEFCDDDTLTQFLDGLIIQRRGPRPEGMTPPAVPEELTNNDILKKLRIAFKLHDGDVVALLAAGGIKLTKSELSALYRKPTHKHYKDAGNQVLRKFLVGLTMKFRPEKK